MLLQQATSEFELKHFYTKLPSSDSVFSSLTKYLQRFVLPKNLENEKNSSVLKTFQCRKNLETH